MAREQLFASLESLLFIGGENRRYRDALCQVSDNVEQKASREHDKPPHPQWEPDRDASMGGARRSQYSFGTSEIRIIFSVLSRYSKEVKAPQSKKGLLIEARMQP